MTKEERTEYNKQYSKKWRLDNKEKIKEKKKIYYQINKEKINEQRKEYFKQYRTEHKEYIKEQRKEYLQVNKEYLQEQRKEYHKVNKERRQDYYRINKERINQYTKQYRTDRRKIDINFKLSCSLRTRLNNALKGNYKSGSAVRDLGCSISELKQHLESKFQDGMMWDNYGEWHIDHIKPLASFNLIDRKHLLEACHYTNLQPLWAIDNLSKGDSIINA
jgi:hypothetical protein